MKRLRYLGHPHASTYHAADLGHAVVRGQEFEVAEAVADRLLDDHPTAFEVVAPEPVEAPVDRMVRAAPKQKAATKKRATRARKPRSRKPKES